MRVDELVQQARNDPNSIQFEQVMAVIEEHYDYNPTTFHNGDIINPAGTNEGSCKIFGFAQLHALSEMETLALFGRYYREDVLANPSGEDHANIRNFLLDGWLGIHFQNQPLKLRTVSC